MKFQRWFFINGLFVFVLYLAVYKNIIGAERIIIFLTWTMFLVAALSCHPDVIKKLREKKKAVLFTVPFWVDLTYDIIITLVLIWYGFTATAAAYLGHIVCLSCVRKELEKEQEDK